MTAPTTVILFGATGDLAKRKLIPGLLHLFQSGLLDDLRVVGTSLDEMSVDDFRALALTAVREHSTRETDDADWRDFAQRLDYLPLSAGPEALRDAVLRAEGLLPGETRLRLHYLSVPPKAALAAVTTIATPGWCERSRIVMEKPFGTDYDSAVALNAAAARGRSTRSRSSASTTSSARSRRRTSSRSGSPTGCSSRSGTATSSTTCRSTCPRPLGLEPARRLLRGDRRLPRHGRHPPVPDPRLHRDGAADRARAAGRSARRRTRSSASCCRSQPGRRRARPVHRLPRRAGRGRATPRPRPSSRCKCFDRQLALGRRAVLPAHRQADGRGSADHLDRLQASRPKSMFPPGSGVGDAGPRPPDLRPRRRVEDVAVVLRQASRAGHAAGQAELQFAMHDTDWVGDVLEAYERLILDADARRPHAVHHRRGHRAAVADRPARCSTTRRRCAPTRRAPGGPTRSTS